MKMRKDIRAVLAQGKGQCCGCTACAMICPVQAITMQRDEEGFRYPVIDPEKCIHCGRCYDACPTQRAPRPQAMAVAMAGAMNDAADTRRSASGGIATALAREILRRGGHAFGVVATREGRVVHAEAASAEEWEAMRGSKYVQSDPGETFRRVRELLRHKIPVLYTGTPCQIAGLSTFLGRDDPNLIRMDIICHGVPSPAIWERYVEEENWAPMTRLTFRDKRLSWHQSMVVIADGEEEKLCQRLYKEEGYSAAFIQNISLRPSCYECHFREGNRYSDITAADYWGVEELHPELDSDDGVSLVICRTEKGRELLAALQAQIHLTEVDSASAFAHNFGAENSATPHPRRAEFFAAFHAGKESVRELTERFILHPEGNK